jgi:hypothetical protein
MSWIPYFPKEIGHFNDLIKLIDVDDLERIRIMLLCLNRLDIFITEDVKYHITLQFAYPRFNVLELLDQMIKFPKDIGTLYEECSYSAITNGHNIGYEISTSQNGMITSMMFDVVLGFTTDNFGDIKTELGEVIIKKDEFYKTSLLFHRANGTMGIVDFWTCDKFPIYINLTPFCWVQCESTDVSMLGCFINYNILRDDMERHFVQNDYKLKYKGLIYNGRLLSESYWNLLN